MSITKTIQYHVDKLLTMKDLSEAFDVTLVAIFYRVENQGLPSIKIRLPGQKRVSYFFVREDVEQWARDNNVAHKPLRRPLRRN